MAPWGCCGLVGVGLGCAGFDGLAFSVEVDFGVDVGGAEVDVAEPGADDVDVDAGVEEVNGGGVADRVR